MHHKFSCVSLVLLLSFYRIWAILSDICTLSDIGVTIKGICVLLSIWIQTDGKREQGESTYEYA